MCLLLRFFSLFLTLFECIDAIYCQPLIFLDYSNFNSFIAKNKIATKNSILYQNHMGNLTVHGNTAHSVLFTYYFQYNAQSVTLCLLNDLNRYKKRSGILYLTSRSFFSFPHIVRIQCKLVCVHSQRVDNNFFLCWYLLCLYIECFL